MAPLNYNKNKGIQYGGTVVKNNNGTVENISGGGDRDDRVV